MLGVTQRSGFGVDLVAAEADVGVLDDRQALGDGRHHPVLDPVVDHLHKVSRTIRAAVQVALLSRSAGCATGRRLGVASTGRDGRPDGIEALDDGVLPADHQAVAAVQTPDTAGRADVDVVDPARSQLRGSREIVAVVGVAAVDDRVIWLEQLGELVHRALDVAGWHHDPDVARALELLNELRETGGRDGSLSSERRDRLGGDVEHNALVPGPHQAAHEVGPHTTQSDHS